MAGACITSTTARTARPSTYIQGYDSTAKLVTVAKAREKEGHTDLNKIHADDATGDVAFDRTHQFRVELTLCLAGLGDGSSVESGFKFGRLRVAVPPRLRRELVYFVRIASLSVVILPAGSQSRSLRGGVQMARAFAGLAATAAITEGQALT